MSHHRQKNTIKYQITKKNTKHKIQKKGIEVEVQETRVSLSLQFCCQICVVSSPKKSPLKPF